LCWREVRVTQVDGGRDAAPIGEPGPLSPIDAARYTGSCPGYRGTLHRPVAQSARRPSDSLQWGLHERRGLSCPRFRLLVGVTTWPVLGILTLGALVRLALLAVPRAWFDEATTGLMGLAVLRGQFPVYFFGQPFMGALDAYLAAPVYLAFGTSFATLKLLPVLLSIAWMGLAARLACDVAGPRAAVWTAILLTIPPDFLLYWTHQARTHYPLGLVLGTLALLLAHRAASVPRPRAAVLFWLLGLVLGLGFWTNFLVLVFFPAAALLAARGGVRRLVTGALRMIPAFALGSLPHWLYGLSHGTAIPPAGEPLPLGALLSHLDVFRRVSWPILVGVPVGLRATWAGAFLASALAVLYGTALFDALRRKPDRADSGRWLGAGLVILAATNVVVALGTVYGRALDDHDQRYLLPVYCALMPLLGVWLARLPPARAIPLGLAVVLVHVGGGVTRTLESFAPTVAAAQAANAEEWQTVADKLAAEGPRHVYDRNPSTRLFTFLSGGRVIFADPAQEIVAEHALAVDGTPRVGWSAGSRTLQASLAALGVRSRHREINRGGAVLVEFVVADDRLVELDPSLFRVEASEGSDASGSVADRRADTLWRTAGGQRGGEWLRVDVGTTARVALIRWLPRTFQEVPRGIRLEASVDGIAWRMLVELPAYDGPLYWSAGRPMQRPRSGRVELRVPPTPARHLRITQTGRDERWRWTVREVFVYADAQGPPSADGAVEGQALARDLRDAGVTRLYADHGWASRVALADPSIRIPPANLFLDNHGFLGPATDGLPPFHWAPGTGALLEPADAPSFVLAARRAGLEFTARSLAGLELFVHAPSPPLPGRPLETRALTVTASQRAERASRAVDGDPWTRWATKGPRAAGDWFRIDLAAPRRLHTVRFTATNPSNLPEALEIEVSADGTSWRKVPATIQVERTLRWGGIALLADSAAAVRLDMEGVTARAVRLVLSEGHPEATWSIHELELRASD
jgi:hypothetical protein